jgi:hypothetical protein
VFRAAFKQQSKRFDPGVQVSGRALGFARPDLDRTEMIEEDEGAYASKSLPGIARRTSKPSPSMLRTAV